MPSFVVIKVKYGDTLRRFNVSVNGEQHFDLNMEDLRQRICSLFNLPSNANIILTYKDEDDDIVTLANDEDLHDVVRQGLNPVRITVELKTDKTASASVPSSPSRGSSSNSQQNLNLNVAEVLNSEPLRVALSKISSELTTKAASSSPLVADLLDALSKMGQSYLNESHTDLGTTNTSGCAGVSDSPKQEASIVKLGPTIDEVVVLNDVQTPSSMQQSSNGTQATRESDPRNPSPSYSHKGKNVHSGSCSDKISDSIKKNKDVVEASAGKSKSREAKLLHDRMMAKLLNDRMKLHASSKKETSDNKTFQFGRCSPKPNFSLNIPSFGRPNFPGQLGYSEVPMGSVFHKGVRCDGCGVLPITGPRYKSKVKHDYDLCSICFGRMGNDADYTRHDFPLRNRDSWDVNGWDINGFHDGFHAFNAFHVPPVPSVPLAPIFKRPSGKRRLDSRFMMDVNVSDGTAMAPLTPFTKIWRMRNNGAIRWQRGLQLLWIGGDRFSSSDAVEIELPSEGVNPGKEVDIAVDFVAPELPGRYVSYWRMAEPSGQKFGQRVWVLIQVDDSVDLTNQNYPKLNLNMPPESNGTLGPEVPDDNEPAQNVEAGNLRSPSNVGQSEDINFPINDDLLITSNAVCPTSAAVSSSAMSSTGADNVALPEASSPLSNADVSADGNLELPSAPPANLQPIIDMSYASSASGTTSKNDESNLVQDHGETNVEATLLKELDEMGFKESDLNKRVLRSNDYDLERSVDDLCGVSEWDPILEELREMGFEDKVTNKKLLAKNNGSITRVVMDLIAGEKPE